MRLTGRLGAWWGRPATTAEEAPVHAQPPGRAALPAAAALAYPVLYLAGVLGSRTLLAAPSEPAWPALPGLTVALLVVFGLRWAALPFLAGLGAAVMLSGAGPALPELALEAAAATLPWTAAAAVLTRRLRLDPALRRLRDVGWFLLVAVGAAPLAAAATRAALAVLGGEMAWPDAPAAVPGWWTADALGVLGVAPILMVLLASRVHPPAPGQAVWRPRLHPWEAAAQALAVVAASLLALLVPAVQHPPLLYACSLPLVWLAVRRGVPGTAAGAAAASAPAVPVLELRQPAGPALAQLESFMVAATAASLCIGALVAERATSQQRQRQLSAILEAAPDCVATVDRAGRLLYLNGAGRRLLHLGEDEEVTGRLLRELLPQLAARLAAQADLGPDLWKGATTMPAARGHRVPLEHVAVAHPADDGSAEAVSAITRDMRQEQRTAARLAQAEEQLDEHRRRLGAVLANVPIALVVAGVDGTCIRAQGRALERLGPARPTRGRSLFQAFQGNDQLVGDLCQAAAGSSVSSSTTLGDAVLETHFQPVVGRNGKVKHVIGLLTDVTDRARAEAVRDDLLARIDARDAQWRDLDSALQADAVQTLTAWLRHLEILEEQLDSGQPVTVLAPVKQTLEQVLGTGTLPGLEAPDGADAPRELLVDPAELEDLEAQAGAASTAAAPGEAAAARRREGAEAATVDARRDQVVLAVREAPGRPAAPAPAAAGTGRQLERRGGHALPPGPRPDR